MRLSFDIGNGGKRRGNKNAGQDPLTARGIVPALFLQLFLLGGSLFLSSFFVLFFNELFNVAANRQARVIEQSAADVPADPVNRANDGKLVVVSGPVATDLSISDGYISVSDTLVLRRNVEMFQWVEYIRRSSKSSSSAHYRKEWSSVPHNSSSFRERRSHVNPAEFPLKSGSFAVSSAKLGGFALNKTDIESLPGGEPLRDAFPIKGFVFRDGYYYSESGRTPAVGDIRLSYSRVPSGGVFTFAARQTPANTLTAMPMKDGSLFLRYAGSLGKSGVLDKLGRQGKLRLNLLRIGGALLMLAGLKLMVRQVLTVLALFPKAERFAALITGEEVLWAAGALVSGTVSFAWIFCNRGQLAYALLVCAACCFVFRRKYAENKARIALNETGSDADDPIKTY